LFFFRQSPWHPEALEEKDQRSKSNYKIETNPSKFSMRTIRSIATLIKKNTVNASTDVQCTVKTTFLFSDPFFPSMAMIAQSERMKIDQFKTILWARLFFCILAHMPQQTKETVL
jgi:hypothetical protein